MKISNKWYLVIVMLLSGALLSACSGGGSSSSTNQQNSAASSVSGVASKGLLSGATVTAYSLSSTGVKGSALGSATTDAQGAYSINIGSYTGSVILEASGGTYTDEATGQAKTNNALLRAAVTNVSGNITAAVTPLTEIAVQKAGTLTAANISAANTLVSNMIGGTDIITTMPANVLASSSSTTAAKNYGLMLAAISQMSYTTSTSVSTVMAQIAADLADNTLNTTGTTLASALSTFIASSSNATGLIATNAQGSIAVYASTAISTNPLYSMQDLAGTWYGAGIKTPTINTNSAFNFGYDVDRLDLNSNGSGIGNTISTSDAASTNATAPAGWLTIKSDGTMVDADSNSTWHSYWFMNASKDVMYQFFNDDVNHEQQLFFVLKSASTYTLSDLDGTWYSAGIKTPIKGSSNSARFGYDVFQTVVNSGTATFTTIATSDVSGTSVLHATIDSNGTISDGIPNSYWYMNASKDVMFNFRLNSAASQELLFIGLKKAASYSAADLVGVWYGAGIRTPIKNTSNAANFGYDIDQIIINADGSGTVTPVATSDPRPVESFPAGSITIANDGTISAGPESVLFMNAGKNVMYELYVNPGTGEQQLFIYLKKATQSNIVGTWVLGDPAQAGGWAIVWFLGDGTYFEAEQGTATPGIEHGTYTWNPSTGAFFATASVDTTGPNGGMAPSVSGAMFIVNSNSMTLHVPGDPDSPYTAARLTADSANPFIGSWHGTNLGPAQSTGVLTFLNDSVFIWVEDGSSVLDPTGHDGMELGTYSMTTTTWTPNVTVDTNGQWGWSSGSGTPIPYTITGNALNMDGSPFGTRIP